MLGREAVSEFLDEELEEVEIPEERQGDVSFVIF